MSSYDVGDVLMVVEGSGDYFWGKGTLDKLPEVTPTDAGKVLTVDNNGEWAAAAPPESGDALPAVSSYDAGKVLMVVEGSGDCFWSKETLLPEFTSSDAGKVLMVTGSGLEWASLPT